MKGRKESGDGQDGAAESCRRLGRNAAECWLTPVHGDGPGRREGYPGLLVCLDCDHFRRLAGWGELAEIYRRLCLEPESGPDRPLSRDFDDAVAMLKEMLVRENPLRPREGGWTECESFGWALLEASPVPMVVRDPGRRVVAVNKAFTRAFGWTLEEIKDQLLENHAAGESGVPDRVEELIDRREQFFDLESVRLDSRGRTVNVNIGGSVVRDDLGRVRGSVLSFEDITERKRSEAEIVYVAYHDVLTGLPNRKSFYIRLEDTLEQYRRRPPESNLWALLILDLDRFKNINDTLGHDLGDELLRAVAARIRNSLRKSDHFFRLGGDEFALIATNLSSGYDVIRVIQKIQAKTAQPFQVRGHELHLTVSIGISLYPGDGDQAEDLVRSADMAMYAAKAEKTGHRFFTEEMNARALERMRLESGLHQAVQEGQFVLFYQPLVDAEGTLAGTEALLRWEHPEYGLVPPDRFISLAEETGAIVPIGAWVVQTACLQARAWERAWGRKLIMAVNLSPRQFSQPGLVETVRAALSESGLEAGRLKLEVTESCLMDDPEKGIRTMERLKNLGLSFAIDDFGTGYSSLSYLRRLPIDTLKIDRSFVRDSVTNRDDQEIIRTIISMAQNLRIETLAEGVETRAQQELMRQYGCRGMQGYYFGRPMPAGDFEREIFTGPGSADSGSDPKRND